MNRHNIGFMVLDTIAKENNLTYQVDLMSQGGTDTANIQRMRAGGSVAGALSIPTRNLHQVVETCHKKDVEDTIILMEHLVKGMDSYTWVQ